MDQVEEKNIQKIGDRIKKLIKERATLGGWSTVGEFYKKMQKIHPNNAITKYSFNRILKNGVKQIHYKTIDQFAFTLGIRPADILQGTKADKETLTIAYDNKPNYPHLGGAETRILEKNPIFIIEEIVIPNNSYRFLKSEFPELKKGDSNNIKTIVDGLLAAGVKLPKERVLKGDFNKLDYILKMRDLHTKFPNLSLPQEIVALKTKRNLAKNELWKLNRFIIQTAFPDHCPQIHENRLRTDQEQDNPSTPESLKYVTVLNGKINLIITNNGIETKKLLTEGHGYSFDAKQLHCFENISPKSSKIQITHYPAKNSIYYK